MKGNERKPLMLIIRFSTRLTGVIRLHIVSTLGAQVSEVTVKLFPHFIHKSAPLIRSASTF